MRLGFLERAQRVDIDGGDERMVGGSITSLAGDRFVAEIPKREGQELLLRAGNKASLCAHLGEGEYRFESAVLSVFEQEGTFRIVFAVPEIAERSQRRQHVRESIRLAVTYAYYSAMAEKTNELSGHSLDVSGGGLRVRAERVDPSLSLVRGTIGEARFHLLPQDEPVHCRAKVVWLKAIIPQTVEFALEFREMHERVRDRIVRHVFVHQADLRKRGLL